MKEKILDFKKQQEPRCATKQSFEQLFSETFRPLVPTSGAIIDTVEGLSFLCPVCSGPLEPELWKRPFLGICEDCGKIAELQIVPLKDGGTMVIITWEKCK